MLRLFVCAVIFLTEIPLEDPLQPQRNVSQNVNLQSALNASEVHWHLISQILPIIPPESHKYSIVLRG